MDGSLVKDQIETHFAHRFVLFLPRRLLEGVDHDALFIARL